jgi:hypothetical protein
MVLPAGFNMSRSSRILMVILDATLLATFCDTETDHCSVASAFRAPKRAPWRVGRHGNKTAAVGCAADTGSIRNSQGDRNSHQKNLLGMTLAGCGNVSFWGAFPRLPRSR